MSHSLPRALAFACVAVLAAPPVLAQTEAPMKASPAPAAVTSGAKPIVSTSPVIGVMPCARHADEPMKQCRFGVVRQGAGGGRVTVSWPDGGERVIVFTGGAPTSFEPVAPGDADTKLSFKRDIDLYQVSIGAERFEIPDVAISGG
ncbi:hypothetical protein [Caulobacter sp. 17J80-11]|uniref:hypothetical protein n=1 Tax=Caulobacter sp. 17J80-11 TaxID=2763502 RepID=UPI001653CC12|nr:hypothetical protein [Caulobacter sp. 17J80-11]MBC6982768.1 hypothetical protein [Caulobacter sp. 17J80-11]